MYARPFTGPPCARMCRDSSYPSFTGRSTFIKITSNSMLAHAAAAWLAFSAKCVMHPKWSSRRPMPMRLSWSDSTTITRVPRENARRPGHRCARLAPPSGAPTGDSSGAAEESCETSVNAHRVARSAAADFSEILPLSCPFLSLPSRRVSRVRSSPPPLSGKTHTTPSWPMCTTSPPLACTESTALASTPLSAAPKAAAASAKRSACFSRASFLLARASASAPASTLRSRSRNPSKVATTTAASKVCVAASFSANDADVPASSASSGSGSSMPRRPSRASSPLDTYGTSERTAEAHSSSAPYSKSRVKCRPFISIAFAVSIVKLLCLNSCTHPIVDCLASDPGLFVRIPVCVLSFFTFVDSVSAPAGARPFSRGRCAFSRRVQAAPFSEAAAMTDSRVSKSHKDVKTSNRGLTTFTRNPFWCLAKM